MRHMIAGLSVLAVAGLAGCVSDERKPAITGMRAPDNPNPTRMVVRLWTMARDTDSNGYPDMIPVQTYLFEDATGWPLPVSIPGTLRFDLSTPQADGRDAKPLTTWDFDAATTQKMIRVDQAGPCYMVDLSLLVPGKTDRLTVETVDLRSTFTPTDPARAKIIGVISMHFGRTR